MFYINWGMIGSSWGGLWLVPMLIWTFIWKGWSLWLSARKGHKIWFLVLLLVNTVGILEIVYIFLFSGEKFGQKKVGDKKVTPPTEPPTPPTIS